MIKSPKPQLSFTALHAAAMENDVITPRKLLRRTNKEINTQNEMGFTPLAKAPLFDDIHEAASNGDVNALKTILKKNPEKRDRQDSKGLTPLHHAVISCHKAVIVALIKAGANVNIYDYDNLPPIAYANDDDLKRLLLDNGAFAYDHLLEDIHLAASQGNIDALNAILDATPEKIDIQDGNGYTPLIWAATNKQLAAAKCLIVRKANVNTCDYEGYSALFCAVSTRNQALVDFLLDNGALVDELVSSQLNLIDIAEMAEEKNKRKPLSQYLRKRIELTGSTLQHLVHRFKLILQQEIQQATRDGKKLLLMLGETHNVYKIMQIEQCFYQAANELGINTLLVERNGNLPIEGFSDLFAQNQLGIKVIGIDNYPCDQTSEDTFMNERNSVMSHEIHRFNGHALLRIGSAHLYGLLENNETRINTDQYHVVPFNLSSVPLMLPRQECDLSRFAADPSRVIQVRQEGFTDAYGVSRFWNQGSVAPHFSLMSKIAEGAANISRGIYSLLGIDNGTKTPVLQPHHVHTPDPQPPAPPPLLVKRNANRSSPLRKRHKINEGDGIDSQEARPTRKRKGQ